MWNKELLANGNTVEEELDNILENFITFFLSSKEEGFKYKSYPPALLFIRKDFDLEIFPITKELQDKDIAFILISIGQTLSERMEESPIEAFFYVSESYIVIKDEATPSDYFVQEGDEKVEVLTIMGSTSTKNNFVAFKIVRDDEGYITLIPYVKYTSEDLQGQVNNQCSAFWSTYLCTNQIKH